MNYIGILGGTFNPIHFGHLMLAESIMRDFSLEKIIFVPNYISPFKTGDTVVDSNKRYEMVKLAINYNPKFDVSDYEINKKNISYTFDTLSYFEEKMHKKIALIVGYDSLLELDSLYKGDKILERFPIFTGKRTVKDEDMVIEKIAEFKKKYNADIMISNLEKINISSTNIRERIKNKLDVSKLLTREVLDYIKTNELYGYRNN